MIVLTDSGATVRIDPVAGGRVASLVVFDRELLVGRDPAGEPYGWGSYPMVPWAGRIRNGEFTFDGHHHSVPVDFGPHSIHGTAVDVGWSIAGPVSDTTATLELDLAIAPKRWTFGGTARQTFSLDEDGLTQVIEVVAGDLAMPAAVGWHPWWCREIGAGTGPLELQIDLRFARRYVRDDDFIPSGVLVPPGPGPWDDCFIGVRDVTLRWPGALAVTVSHDCSHVVIFDRPDHAICVEPQSGPPDAFTLEPEASRLAAGATLRREMRWTWTRLA